MDVPGLLDGLYAHQRGLSPPIFKGLIHPFRLDFHDITMGWMTITQVISAGGNVRQERCDVKKTTFVDGHGSLFSLAVIKIASSGGHPIRVDKYRNISKSFSLYYHTRAGVEPLQTLMFAGVARTYVHAMLPCCEVWNDRSTRTLRRFLLQVRHLPVPSSSRGITCHPQEARKFKHHQN